MFISEVNPGDGGTPKGGGAGGIVPVIIAAGTSIYNTEQQKKMQRENHAYNSQAAEAAYGRNLDMWERQNRYNDPSAQMARLKAAGLNPNMVYGQGSGGASGHAGDAPQFTPPQRNFQHFSPLDIPQTLGMYQDFQIKNQQLNNLKAQAENTRAKTINEHSRKLLLDVQGKRGQLDYDQQSYLNPYEAAITGNQARASEAKLLQEWQRVSLMSQEELKNVLQTQQMEKNLTSTDLAQEQQRANILFSKYRNEWAKMGITSSDNMLVRVLAQMLGQAGISDWLQNSVNENVKH
jgi:hypothetical protein